MPREAIAILRKINSSILGHVISRKGVATDPKKVEAMQSWLTRTTIKHPRIQNVISVAIAIVVSVAIQKNRSNTKTVSHIAAKTQFDQLENLFNAAISSRFCHILNPCKQLRGFLGITGYYRKFIKGYSIISKPLTDLRKNRSSTKTVSHIATNTRFGQLKAAVSSWLGHILNHWTWSDKAKEAFIMLKETMTTAPMLALPNLQEQFVIETDALGLGIGVVLVQ